MKKKQKLMIIRMVCTVVLSLGIYIGSTFIPDDLSYITLILFLIPYLLISYDVLYNAIIGIIHGQIFNEKLLMSIATIGALIIGEYAEGVAVMLFFQVGELFEHLAVEKSRKSIASLMEISPTFATVIRNNEEMEVDPSEVLLKETIIIKPGEKIPLDGTIIDGSASINTQALTGESLPQDKTIGDHVISGTININGVIKVQVESIYEDSTVAKILELVENSSEKKAKTESFISKFAKYYTPTVVISALLLAIIPPLAFKQDWSEWIHRALTFLVVSCPCALVISVPLSFFGGIGGASRNGILIKGSNYLETLSKIKTVVFDKTGTLTKGSFYVEAIHPENISVDELLDISAAAESYSNHPVAESIIRAHGGHINPERITKIIEHSGQGIEAVIDEKTFYVGNKTLMETVGAKWHDCHLVGTIIHIACENNYLGHIVINDEIKNDSKEALNQLKQLGITKTIMLTGDSQKVADLVSEKINIDETHAELLPNQKVEIVESILNNKDKVAFVGDGINDAPVLTRVDIGIAMGMLGSDVAIEAADVVLMDDSPMKVATAIKIARKTMKIVYENIWFSLIIKIAILILSAFGLVNMWVAVFGDVGVMIIAILNAMRTMKIIKTDTKKAL